MCGRAHFGVRVRREQSTSVRVRSTREKKTEASEGEGIIKEKEEETDKCHK